MSRSHSEIASVDGVTAEKMRIVVGTLVKNARG
jgi:hypothetical protein